MRTRSAAAVALLFTTLSPVAQAGDPVLDYWVNNLTGRLGNSPSACVDRAIDHIPADIQRVRYTVADVWVEAQSIPSYAIGPWDPVGGPPFPNLPQAQCHLRRIPRNPTAATMAHTPVGLGQIGIWVNGVAVFNSQDGIVVMSGGTGWRQNACVTETEFFDDAVGHPTANCPALGPPMPPSGCLSIPPDCPAPTAACPISGVYHHHCSPTGLRNQLGDDGRCHSPLLGFAYDGFPIYGPYGYSNPADAASPVVRMQSGYQLRATRLPGGPSTLTYPLGSFVEDFEYTGGPGTLDIYNSRDCVTPEYPLGTHAYFATIDTAGNPAYPYILGPQYYGVVVTQPPPPPPPGAVTYAAANNWPCPEICRDPAPARACFRGTATFVVSVRYFGQATFQWEKNGAPLSDGPTGSGAMISGAHTGSLTITGAVGADAGNYRCRVTGECGTLTSLPAALTVCSGDINCSGSLSVQDIFDFLGAYFALLPRGDFNNNGAWTVQDIFDFLAAYFAGCS